MGVPGQACVGVHCEARPDEKRREAGVPGAMQPTPRHRDDVRSIIHASVADMRASFHAEIEQNARAKLRASLAKVQRHRVEVGGEHPDATTLERFNADSARRSPEGGGDAPPATPEGTEPGIIDLDAGDDEGDDGDGGVGKDDADGDADADEDAMDVIDLDLERPAVVVEVGHAIDGGVLPGTLPKRLPLAPAAVQARIQLESPAESAAENEVEAEVEAVPPLVVIPMQPYLAVAHGEVTRVAFSDLEIRTSARVSKGGGGGGARRRKRKGGGGGGNKSGGHRTVSLTHVNPVPMYNAWVPIKNEFWCGKDFFREPHMPFYGDEESQRKKSLNVYANMVVALGGPARGTHEDPQEEVSDGELDSSGHFIPPGDEDADGWMAYHSLAERRAREVTRAVILQVHREIPLEGNVVAVAALVQALGLRSPRHVRKHLQRALVEERRAAEATEKFVATRKVRHRLKDAMEVDVGYADDVDEAWFADHAPLPLEGFCFTCHTFSCRQHEGHNVEPVVPIKDAGVERRNAAIAAIRMAVAAGVKIGMSEASGEDSDGSYDGREPDRSGGSDGSAGASVAVYRDPVVAICGKNCHLDSKWLSSPPNPSCCSRPSGGSDGGIDEGGGLDGEVNWTLEERLIVREAIAVFKNDACSIARTMGGSKTCRETATYMKGPEMAFVVRKIVSETTKKRWPREVNRGGDGAVDEVLLGKEDGAGSSSTRDKHAAQNSQRQGQVSCCGGEDVDLDEIKDFVPCAHTGPCDKAACSCFQNNLDCEATCGCNNGRWTDKRGYVAGTNGEHNWRKICIRRHLGCVCRPGDNCSTEKCACWVANRACDPDFCQTCEAGPLPDMIHPRQRSCRNVGALTGWHKKT